MNRLDLGNVEGGMNEPGCQELESNCRRADDGLNFIWPYEMWSRVVREGPRRIVSSRQPYFLAIMESRVVALTFIGL